METSTRLFPLVLKSYFAEEPRKLTDSTQKLRYEACHPFHVTPALRDTGHWPYGSWDGSGFGIKHPQEGKVWEVGEAQNLGLAEWKK